MTPDKIPKPSTFENYDITDLNSGDETDDDEAPRKKIPEWALGKYDSTCSDVLRRYSKTCLKRPLKNRQNKCLKDKW